MHCCNINKGRRGDFFLVHLVLTLPGLSQYITQQQKVA